VSLRAGVQCLLQTVGLGKMQPNILLVFVSSIKYLENNIIISIIFFVNIFFLF
jgi:hypothetical protein